ncbi:hypothetical protein Ddye_012320 [Dipteronia dyeriana]|uniref:Reverse transcriptase n=1 Tax=Dipteronia dyeriana TaxID=168575 RepID=A0AAE0CIH9_9ROSI|nr:hypothetical protein Ddye_012320 [Dipteronia dyeriana]
MVLRWILRGVVAALRHCTTELGKWYPRNKKVWVPRIREKKNEQRRVISNIGDDERDCQAIKRVLDCYANASGQVVKFQKSVMCVSRKVCHLRAVSLARILGVNLVECHGSYLWLPKFVGMNKKQLFFFISDRFWNKIKGWRSIINDLHRLSMRFWWGSTEEFKKIHLCARKSLCSRKDLGGLGFQDLAIFNQALLAKQWWRLIHFLIALAAKVYLGKELLDAGSRCCIGNGSSASIYHDHWLPRPISFKFQTPPVFNISAKFSSLKLPSGAWNEDLVCAFFWPDEASLILNLPFSLSPSSNAVLWHFDKSRLVHG